MAGERVVLAETKDHQNWALIGHLAEHGEGEDAGIMAVIFGDLLGIGEMKIGLSWDRVKLPDANRASGR